MRQTGRLAVSTTLLLATLAFLQLWSHGEAVPIRAPLDRFPMELGEWQGRETTVIAEDVLEILQPSDYLMRRYEDRLGHDVWLYVGYWETQKKGTQIHSPKNCLPGGGWQPLEADVVPVAVAGRTIEVNRYVLQKGPDQLVVGYWFLAQGEPVAGELESKIAMIRNSILHNRSDGAIVRVSTAAPAGMSDRAWAVLEDYIREMTPRLEGFLPG